MIKNTTKYFTIACSLSLLLATSIVGSVQAGAMIKWVDKNGIVHYGDAVPADQSDYAREELSDQGVVVKSVDRAKTAKELADDRRQEALKLEEERKLAELAAKDHVLLATFSSEDDMVMTRDGKIAAIGTILRLTEDRIMRVTQQLQELAHQAAEIERSGQAVPDVLHQQIASAKAEILHHKQYVETQHTEQESIRIKFERDIKRFRFLQHRVAQMEAETR